MEGTPEQDANFGQMVKRFLVKTPANIIFLTEVDLKETG